MDYNLAHDAFLERFKTDSKMQEELFGAQDAGFVGAHIAGLSKDLEEMEIDKPEKWTYELLAEDPLIQEMVHVMMKQVRHHTTGLQRSVQPLRH